jgi:hypothetical protein
MTFRYYPNPMICFCSFSPKKFFGKKGLTRFTACYIFPEKAGNSVTITASEIGLYIAGLFLLFLTPGPVWVAMLARGLKGGFAGAWPLALGVAFGDFTWAVAALLTLNQLTSLHADLIFWLKYVAVIVFFAMGIQPFAVKNRGDHPSQSVDPSGHAGRAVCGHSCCSW